MKILNQTDRNLPFEWAASYEAFVASRVNELHIYLRDDNDPLEGLITLFHSLFGSTKEKLIIYDEQWWNLCLDVWDKDNKKYDHTPEGKTEETREYLRLLKGSEIELDYSGCCTCNDWNTYLPIILKVLFKFRMGSMAGPVFCLKESNIQFHFDCYGSYGVIIEYLGEPSLIQHILSYADEKYDVNPPF